MFMGGVRDFCGTVIVFDRDRRVVHVVVMLRIRNRLGLFWTLYS